MFDVTTLGEIRDLGSKSHYLGCLVLGDLMKPWIEPNIRTHSPAKVCALRSDSLYDSRARRWMASILSSFYPFLACSHVDPEANNAWYIPRDNHIRVESKHTNVGTYFDPNPQPKSSMLHVNILNLANSQSRSPMIVWCLNDFENSYF